MNNDEFAFVNQQLAGMLKSGIPLEGALQQLSSTMQRGQLRGELEKLHGDLALGIPLRQAIATRSLPDFYVRMMQVGAQSNDLPGMLTLLADYYQKKNFFSTRLKGLLIYPFILLIATLALAIFLGWSLSHFAHDLQHTAGIETLSSFQFYAPLVIPIGILSWMAVAFFIAMVVPAVRNYLRWRVPGFREANLAYFASSLQLMLKQGVSLNDALVLFERMEASTPLGKELSRWQDCLSSGKVKSTDLAQGSTIIPPLFFWLIAGEEENWVKGLGRSAEIYYARATHKIDLILYAVLPIAILFIGNVIFSEIYPFIRMGIKTMDSGFSDS